MDLCLFLRSADLSIPMEILPHLTRSSQVTDHELRADSFACDKNGHRFKTCLQQASAPPRAAPPATRGKDKVVFVLGSTGTGKSKLAIDLATHFGGEVVNSDKMQVYTGLNVITNKVTDEERAGIPHHLIGGVHPDAEFTAADFCREATRAVEAILARHRLPVIAGGSNSYIEELVIGDGGKFESKYDCCFVWIDVELPVLHSFVSARVDKMVEMGLLEEARGVFEPEAADYTNGIRKSIGVREMDRFFRAELSLADEMTKARLLKEAIDEIKENTCELTCNQLQKIRRFSTLLGWEVHRVDATEAFRKRGEVEEAEQAWKLVAREPSIKIVQKFLNGELMDNMGMGFLKKIMTISAAGGGGTDGNNEPADVITTVTAIDVNTEHEHKVSPRSWRPPTSTSELGWWGPRREWVAFKAVSVDDGGAHAERRGEDDREKRRASVRAAY